MKFITECVCLNWLVLEPVGDCDRFDCVIDRGNGFERIQVKTGRLRKGSMVFRTCSTNHYVRDGKVIHSKSRCYVGDADFFGVYCPDTDTCYMIPVVDVGKATCSLRVDSSKIAIPTIRVASNYTLDRWAIL